MMCECIHMMCECKPQRHVFPVRLEIPIIYTVVSNIYILYSSTSPTHLNYNSVVIVDIMSNTLFQLNATKHRNIYSDSEYNNSSNQMCNRVSTSPVHTHTHTRSEQKSTYSSN